MFANPDAVEQKQILNEADHPNFGPSLSLSCHISLASVF
jgi:hypothetical protein